MYRMWIRVNTHWNCIYMPIINFVFRQCVLYSVAAYGALRQRHAPPIARFSACIMNSTIANVRFVSFKHKWTWNCVRAIPFNNVHFLRGSHWSVGYNSPRVVNNFFNVNLSNRWPENWLVDKKAALPCCCRKEPCRLWLIWMDTFI